jgi:hypothetical protein
MSRPAVSPPFELDTLLLESARAAPLPVLSNPEELVALLRGFPDSGRKP